MGVTKLGNSKTPYDTLLMRAVEILKSVELQKLFNMTNIETSYLMKISTRIKTLYVYRISWGEIKNLLEAEYKHTPSWNLINDSLYYSIPFMTCFILEKLRYAHWNQYYFDKMSDETLCALIESIFKKLKVKSKLNTLNADFN